ncbi:MAG: M23 family metallopeptidase [Clostridia bacterium]|nr:M23 family metallopeptidase [Clostridia bacterium]
MDARKPIIVGFPLRGEWLSPNTPGSRVPSHGTNRYGTRYAYDFVQVDWHRTGRPAYRAGLWRYLLFGLPLQAYYCWGQPVYAPCDGIVVRAEDGCAERARTSLISDLANAHRNAHRFDPRKEDARTIAGNHVIIRMDERVYAALVHLQVGSVQARVGQRIKKGDILGRVGHSGNSFMPHLHFQLMDSEDMVAANGLPCAFERYEVRKNGAWQIVVNGIPTHRDRIRFSPDSEGRSR